MMPATLPLTATRTSLAELVCAGLHSPHTRRVYGRHISGFLKTGLPLTRSTVHAYLQEMRRQHTQTGSCNQALSALKKYAEEAYERGLLGKSDWLGIHAIKAAPRYGIRAGNWLTLDQCSALLKLPDCTTLSGVRDAAILALLIGCGLRRNEAALLTWGHVQKREGRMVICDLVGKKSRVRTIPIPGWAADYLRAWSEALQRLPGAFTGVPSDADRVFWAISGAILVNPLTESGVWWIVKEYARKFGMPNLAPHDLRRTFGKLARDGGAEWEDIQESLGHANLATTQNYVGKWLKLKMGEAAGDHIKL